MSHFGDDSFQTVQCTGTEDKSEGYLNCSVLYTFLPYCMHNFVSSWELRSIGFWFGLHVFVHVFLN